MKDKPSNDGLHLEHVVQEIERLLTPTDLDIKVREKVFDDDGVQIAEFDIIISGEVGTGSINWLIECRDRPSEGKAPKSWIEQLIGRRKLHRLPCCCGFHHGLFSSSYRRCNSGAHYFAHGA